VPRQRSLPGFSAPHKSGRGDGPPVAVFGAGAWGTALALACGRAGRPVTLWARRPDHAATLRRDGVNAAYLPGVPLDPAPEIAEDLALAAQGAAIALLAVPAQTLRALAVRLAESLAPEVPAVICAKGIEAGSGKLMSEVLAEVRPGAPLAVLSGPTFAAEVARGLPTAVTLAAREPALAEHLCASLGGADFRPYAHTDVVGVDLGGAVKNVIAIACGIVAGRGLGENARAALMTRGLAEITRLVVAKGGAATTPGGLSGLGDVALSCASRASRNFSLGVALGQGLDKGRALAGTHAVVEGAETAGAVAALAARLEVDLPICTAVDAVLNHGAALDAEIAALLSRPFRPESG